MADEPQVTVEVLRYHTYADKPRLEGETYEAEEKYVETLEALFFVRRVATPPKATPKPRAK